MSIIGRMLTRMILIRFLFILFGISIFVISLDAVTFANEILALRGGSLKALPEYALLRAPGVLSTFLPMSVLLALLLTLTELSYRNEIPAIWAAGVSPFRLMIMLIPLGLALGATHYLLNDQGVPAAAPVLREWAIGDYGKKRFEVGENDPIWMRAGTDILRAGRANLQATELSDVIIFRRDPDGLLREQIVAATAKQTGDRWLLAKVIVYYRESLEPSRLDTLVYTANFKPAAAGARSGDPEEMSLKDLSFFIENSGFGIRPTWVYQTWWHKRLGFFIMTLLMIAMCVPLAMRFRRGGGLGILFAVGTGLGFIFFVTDGIALTMGELGFAPPWLAAWGPVLVFAALAAAIGFRTERV